MDSQTNWKKLAFKHLKLSHYMVIVNKLIEMLGFLKFCFHMKSLT